MKIFCKRIDDETIVEAGSAALCFESKEEALDFARFALRRRGILIQQSQCQNWMRDYDPTTGRYIQADPLGLVDGPSVYGYALQNPGRYTDPTGEFIPLLFIVGGLILGEVIDQINEHCGCDDTHASERYTSLGAVAEVVGPTHKKIKRPIKGSSARHSLLSGAVGETKMKRSSKAKIRKGGRAIAKRLPGVGAAFLIYDAAKLAECLTDTSKNGS